MEIIGQDCMYSLSVRSRRMDLFCLPSTTVGTLGTVGDRWVASIRKTAQWSPYPPCPSNNWKILGPWPRQRRRRKKKAEAGLGRLLEAFQPLACPAGEQKASRTMVARPRTEYRIGSFASRTTRAYFRMTRRDAGTKPRGMSWCTPASCD